VEQDVTLNLNLATPVLIDRDRQRKPARPKINFEARARKVHGDKYDYSQAVYVSTHVSVVISCPTAANSMKLTASALLKPLGA
jgi:hypothetical protein